MAKELYSREAAFRTHVDACAQILGPHLGVDLREILYPSQQSGDRLDQPEFGLPALFTIEYALAQLWMSYGVRPQAMLGHSHGEYVAACLAGVFSLADALKLVAARGRLIGRLDPGAMLAVRAPEDQARDLLAGKLSLAAVNSRNACVVTGPVGEVEEFKRILDENRIGHKDLPARHAYHSDMVDPILDEFAGVVEEVEKNGPAIPYISSLTGTWIRPEQTMDARYWTSQMRYTVRFADGLETLAKENFSAFVEAGPEHTLCALARQHLGRSGETLILPSMGRSGARASDWRTLLDTMGRLWAAGVEVDWLAFYKDQARNRLPLPTYQFDRRRYWIEAMVVRRAENELAEEKAEAAAVGQTARVDFAARSGQTSARHPVDRTRLQSAYAEPQTDLEIRLVEIWGEVLGLEGIGAQDNFFDLGGDSLLATQVYSRIQQIIPASVSVRDILSYQTVAEFASAMAELPAQDQGRPSAQSEMRPVPRDRELPLSFSQQRLWFLDQTTPGSPVYNLSIAVWLSGELSFTALQRSVDEVVRRHEALRTTFATVEGQPVQVIARELKLPLTVVDLTQLTESTREGPMQAMMAEMINQPFDLARGPLLRLYLLRLGEQDQVALFVTHHVVSDAWSLGVFIREIALLYDSFCKGMPSPLPELEIQYADFAYWQRKWLQGEMLEKQVGYWKKQLGGKLPVLHLPTDRPRPPTQTTRGGTIPFILPTALTDGLRELSRGEGVTLFMTLLAGLQTLLYRYSGQDDIVVGAPSAGRTRPETEPLIGFFINMLVLRTDLSNNPQFKDLLHRVEETMLGAFANQDVPFEKLVEVLQPERDLSRTPLFQVLFNFMNTPAPPVDASGLTMVPVQIDSKVARFDLLLNITEMPDGLACSLQYNTDLFDAATVEKMIAHFETLLEDLVARPECRIDSLEMLTAEEKQRLAEEQARLEKTHIAKLKGARRKAISFSQEQLVKTGFLSGGQQLPVLIEPEIDEVNLIGWVDKNRAHVEGLLLKHGAILFRGFRSVSASNLRQFAEAFTPDLLDYNYRSTPRTVVGDKVYTSTEYPAHQAIPLHNENAYTRSWPMKIWFYCDQPASEGGETPIADSRELFRLLDPKITKRFIEKGITYVRNYGEGLDLHWQEVFQTSDRGEVERYCKAVGMEFEWKDGERLRTRQLCQAIASHPKTGETVWFNQAHLFHMSSLGAGLQSALLGSFGEEDLPRNAYYGDGSRIEASVLDEVRAAYQQAATVFAWREGDVLMVDNMLVAHGRNPYVGPRRVLVVMAEPYGISDGISDGISGGHSHLL
jgi:malonyl CoA-acyl carrier protein transacylase/alpha-ketoglutarate-dependent taurine dioxygenase